LKPGPYFLTIYSNGQSLTKRIVKIWCRHYLNK
jgi:hypothetical protein